MGRLPSRGALVLGGCLALLAASPAHGQDGVLSGLQKSVEGVFSTVSTTTTFASGAVTKTDTTSFLPALHLNLDALVYPRLRLSAGGVWEWNTAATEGVFGKTTSTITRNRPFFLLRSTNEVFSPGIGYFRREERARTAGLSDVKLVSDEYAGYLGWNPAGGPDVDLQYLRTNTFDDARAYQDVTKDYGSLISSYRRRDGGVYYLGTLLNTTNRIERVETQQLGHSARLDYSGTYFRERVRWNATYNVNYRDLKIFASDDGEEVAFPLAPSDGLSSVSDTPATSRLSPNGPLIDGNVTAGAGVDLGVPSSPTEAQARNIGLDFLNPAEVNRLLVWVDRDLPAEIASSFSWEVYSSADNLRWRREAAVPAAPFGPFENRFEIDFPTVLARYVKVVTRPLSATAPDSARFPDILVSEIQAFLRRTAGQGEDRITQTSHLLNTDVRMRILDAPSLYYEGYYIYNGSGGSGSTTDTLSNGLSVQHAFGRAVSVYGRAALEQGTTPVGDREAGITDATVTIDPIPTFRSSWLYTGRNEEVAGLKGTQRAVIVQNAAQLYRGVDVIFGFGWNSSTRASGESDRSRLINVSATVVPRSRVSLTFNYDATSTDRTGALSGPPRSSTRRGYAAVSIAPTRTLHLLLGGDVFETTDQQTRTTINVGANWAPFPDGTLQFVFALNEALRDLVFGTERSTLGAVRWNVSRRSYVDVSFQRTKSEFVQYVSESRILSVTAKVFF